MVSFVAMISTGRDSVVGQMRVPTKGRYMATPFEEIVAIWFNCNDTIRHSAVLQHTNLTGNFRP